MYEGMGGIIRNHSSDGLGLVVYQMFTCSSLLRASRRLPACLLTSNRSAHKFDPNSSYKDDNCERCCTWSPA